MQSVDDKGQAGAWNPGQGARSGHWAAEASAAVAEMLGGPASSAPVEISVKCTKLPNKDLMRCGGGGCSCSAAWHSVAFPLPPRPPLPLPAANPPLPPPPARSLSDPMAVLLVGDSRGQTWTEVGRTDVVANTLNPAFRQPLLVSYQFEALQPCRLVVYDADVVGDPTTLHLEDQDFLGGWAGGGAARGGADAGRWRHPLLALAAPSLQAACKPCGGLCRRRRPTPCCAPLPAPCDPPAAAQGTFLLSDVLTSQGQTMTIQLGTEQGRVLPGCTATLLAEEVPNTNAMVRGRAWGGWGRPLPAACGRTLSG